MCITFVCTVIIMHIYSVITIIDIGILKLKCARKNGTGRDASKYYFV